MSNIRSLKDKEIFKEDDSAPKKDVLNFFVGGKKSGLALETPSSENQINLNQQGLSNFQQNSNLFSGEGHTTGSVSQHIKSSTIKNQSSKQQQESLTSVQIDPNIPRTTLQFRLADGSIIQQEFNSTHTIQDLYKYVDEVYPSVKKYKLLSGFPQKPISKNLSLTLEDSGLLNESLTQSQS